jgi:hypothetical protein
MGTTTKTKTDSEAFGIAIIWIIVGWLVIGINLADDFALPPWFWSVSFFPVLACFFYGFFFLLCFGESGRPEKKATPPETDCERLWAGPRTFGDARPAHTDEFKGLR